MPAQTLDDPAELRVFGLLFSLRLLAEAEAAEAMCVTALRRTGGYVQYLQTLPPRNAPAINCPQLVHEKGSLGRCACGRAAVSLKVAYKNMTAPTIELCRGV